MKKILIILNSVKHNRGSEALIRGLIRICKSENEQNQLYLASSEPDFEDTVYLEGIDKYINRYAYKSAYSPKRIWAAILRRIFHKTEAATCVKCGKLIKCAEKMDVVIVIGADNYDRSYKMYPMLHELNVVLRKKVKGKLVLYDCSLEKDDINSDVADDFNLFDKVTAREDITLKNLLEILPEAKVSYYPDPAFLMEPKKVDLPENWLDNNMIGINLSNLVLQEEYGNNKEKILSSYCRLVEHILDNMECNIVFIPHVMNGQDLSILRLLYNKYSNTGRVCLIENEELTAQELKYIISKCRFFIGARTHATIAAYSCAVPTLVMGYSVKSIGIARDIFGTEENYVISVKNLKTEEDLKEGFCYIAENEKSIQEKLLQKMPEYKKIAWKASELVK